MAVASLFAGESGVLDHTCISWSVGMLFGMLMTVVEHLLCGFPHSILPSRNLKPHQQISGSLFF